MEVNWIVVLSLGTLTALATGLGAVPFFVRRTVKQRTVGAANAMAAGLMLTASYSLVMEAWQVGSWTQLILGALTGLLILVLTRRVLRNHEDIHLRGMTDGDSMRIILIMVVMTMHSFSEGVGVGVALADSSQLGIYVTLAIALHNIPEGLAISLVLVPSGVSPARAAWWSIFSSLPQPLLALPSYLLVTAFRPLLPAGLAFAAGAMLWMVVAELVPTARQKISRLAVLAVMVLAALGMYALTVLLPGP